MPVSCRKDLDLLQKVAACPDKVCFNNLMSICIQSWSSQYSSFERLAQTRISHSLAFLHIKEYTHSAADMARAVCMRMRCQAITHHVAPLQGCNKLECALKHERIRHLQAFIYANPMCAPSFGSMMNLYHSVESLERNVSASVQAVQHISDHLLQGLLGSAFWKAIQRRQSLQGHVCTQHTVRKLRTSRLMWIAGERCKVTHPIL